MSRGFEKISSQVDNDNVIIPSRGTLHAAAYDFSTPITVTIKPGEVAKIKTGIKAYMMDDEVLHMYVRSSSGIKRNLGLANQVGVIDSDYYNNPDNEGEIIIALRNNNTEEITLEAGERITQAVFQKFLKADNETEPGQTRLGGVGSTGK